MNRTLNTALQALLTLVILGCVSVPVERDAQGYQWALEDAARKPVIFRDVDVFLNCGFTIGAKACSIMRGDECHVYLPPNPEPWLESHELRHCEGWRHP